MTGSGPLTRRIQARRTGQQSQETVCASRAIPAPSTAAPPPAPVRRPEWLSRLTAKDMTGRTY
jgi:hypothetical protein